MLRMKLLTEAASRDLYEKPRCGRTYDPGVLKGLLLDRYMGIVFYRYGMEPGEDLAFGEAQYLRFLDYLTSDSAKKYPGWCVVGVMAQDDPHAAEMNAILRPSPAVTVN